MIPKIRGGGDTESTGEVLGKLFVRRQRSHSENKNGLSTASLYLCVESILHSRLRNALLLKT